MKAISYPSLPKNTLVGSINFTTLVKTVAGQAVENAEQSCLFQKTEFSNHSLIEVLWRNVYLCYKALGNKWTNEIEIKNYDAKLLKPSIIKSFIKIESL